MAAGSGRSAVNVLLIVGLGTLVLSGAALTVWFWMLSSSNRLAPAAEPAMLAMPESSLVYPGATHVQKVGQGTECRDGTWQPALVEFTFATKDSTRELFVWYYAQLRPLGWTGGIPDAQSTGYSLTRAPDDLFEIDAELNVDSSPYRVDDGGTQFRTDFQHSFKQGHC